MNSCEYHPSDEHRSGVEFGDAFNCVWLGEYFTYEGEPYRNTVAHYEHQLAELDEKIADAASANEKKAFRDRKALLIARHDAKTDEAIASEDMGRMEDYKLEARTHHNAAKTWLKARRNCFSAFRQTCQKYRSRRSRST